MTEEQLDNVLARTLGDPQVHAFREVVHDVDAAWGAPVRRMDASAVATGRTAKRRRFPLRRSLALAASVLLLAVVGYWSLSGPTTGIEDYLTPYEVSFAVRGATDANVADLRAAQRAYQAGDYVLAAERFAALPNDVTTEFYHALSLLLTREAAGVAQAAPLLAILAERDDHLYQEQARWYWALALVELGETEKAAAALSEVAPGAYKYAEAQEVLRLLGE